MTPTPAAAYSGQLYRAIRTARVNVMRRGDAGIPHTFSGTSKPLRYSRVSRASASLSPTNVSVFGSIVSLRPTR